MADEKLVAEAWDAVKAADDASYGECREELKLDLRARADGIEKSGRTVGDLAEDGRDPGVFDNFEEKYRELFQKAKDPVVEAVEEEAETPAPNKPLGKLKRAELDELAAAKGLDPAAYPNKAALVEALEGLEPEALSA
jgi:hypothetical protein